MTKYTQDELEPFDLIISGLIRNYLNDMIASAEANDGITTHDLSDTMNLMNLAKRDRKLLLAAAHTRLVEMKKKAEVLPEPIRLWRKVLEQIYGDCKDNG